ncbi:TPA: ead/Ea22-like family protein [Escherichia coli]|nr:ead/Ea22-like family protein [Escherichia coli]
MSKINYQALREAAEKATWGDWDSYKPHRGARGYEVRLSSQAIAQHVLKNNAEFIAAFNPKVALALLDERERNQQYIKRRDQENEDIALTVGKLRVELEAAKKRIAELEAELVSQTYKLNELSGNSPVTPDGWISCSERMPEIRQTVIGWNGYAVRQCVYTRNEYAKTQKGREPRFETLTGIWHGVTHWMPLPEPPQEVK